MAELNQLKKENQIKLRKKKARLLVYLRKQKLTETQTQPIISNFDGLMARINALNKLPWLPSFFIFLLFLAIETAPIFSNLSVLKENMILN